MLTSINWHNQVSEFFAIFDRTFLFIFATIFLFYLSDWIIPSKKKQRLLISSKKRRLKCILIDLTSTITTIVVFSITTQLAFLFYFQHHPSLLYLKLNAHGWFYLIISFPLLIFLHDTYFYWAHRLLHHRLIFRYVHKLHHVSQQPTAFSAFAFSPIEAFIQSLFIVLLPAIIPVQEVVFVVFTWAIIIEVIYGHNGYEKSTLKNEKRGFYKVLSTPTYHEMHHTRPNTNFGLWLVFWDKLMGTYNKTYYKSLLQILSRK